MRRLPLIGAIHKIGVMERFSHGSRATYVGNNRLIVKAVVHDLDMALFVQADDKLLTPWFVVSGRYENELTAYLYRHVADDSHCIDVGTNFGYFTCLMAKLCPRGRVIGVEADHETFTLACDSVYANDLQGRTTVLNRAANADGGEVTLFRRRTRSGNTSIARASDHFTELLGEPPQEPFVVAGIRVDDLLEPLSGRIDFMKIDVEGAEPLVIAGAREAIRANDQIRILMEWSPGQIAAAGQDVGAFLAELERSGLRPYRIGKGRPRAIGFDELRRLEYQAAILLKKA